MTEDTTVHPTTEEVRAAVGVEEIGGQLVVKAKAGHLRSRLSEAAKPDDGVVHPTTDEVRKAAGFKEVAGFLVPESQAEEHEQLIKSQATMPAPLGTPAAENPTATRTAEAAPNPAQYRTRRARADNE
jgi:hypothetical protein